MPPLPSSRPLPSRPRLPASLADQVYTAVRDAIIHGQFAPGQKLVELDLAAWMGTSQGPVREALQRLERDGLVERRARSATYVTAVVADEIYELFAIRSLIEGFAIRRALPHIGPVQLNELEDLLEAMRAAGHRDDMGDLVSYDMLFHRRICEWSGSAVLLRTWLPPYSQIQRYVAQNHRGYFGSLIVVADTHQPILDAIRQGDPETAARVLQEHIMLIWSSFTPQPTADHDNHHTLDMTDITSAPPPSDVS